MSKIKPPITLHWLKGPSEFRHRHLHVIIQNYGKITNLLFGHSNVHISANVFTLDPDGTALNLIELKLENSAQFG